jgi:hypothetical protein
MPQCRAGKIRNKLGKDRMYENALSPFSLRWNSQSSIKPHIFPRPRAIDQIAHAPALVFPGLPRPLMVWKQPEWRGQRATGLRAGVEELSPPLNALFRHDGGPTPPRSQTFSPRSALMGFAACPTIVTAKQSPQKGDRVILPGLVHTVSA